MDGSWISFPISPGEMVLRVRAATLARLGVSAVRASLTPGRSETFADVVGTGLGRAMGDLFYFPYASKIWGVEPERLSGEQARRRISADSPWKLARKAFSGGGAGREFFYPRHGFGQIASALADAARDTGADLRLGSPVTAISQTPSGMEVTTRDETMETGLVLSTIPITLLARFLDPPNHVSAALGSLEYRAMVLVYMTVPQQRWTPYDAHYFPGADVPFTRISEPKNYRDGDDQPDRTVLCVEVPCDPGDTVWEQDDRTLVAGVRESVIDLGLPDPGTHGEVRRIRHAYPIYRVGSEDAFGQVASWIDEQRGIVSYGRQGLFAHDNTHHAMAMARDAVACVSSALDFDDAAWDRARERFAQHVVED